MESRGNPYELITDTLVTEALKKDVDLDAELISWTVKDFTRKGDNYVSIVSSIEVCYSVKKKEESEKTYVVKMNPMRPESPFSPILEDLCTREPMILEKVIAGMNLEMENLNLDPIRTPKIFAYDSEAKRQIFIAEDLRPQGFKMHDRTKGMDLDHALLVVKELGRFHSSSLVFENTLPTKSIPKSFGISEEPFLNAGDGGKEMCSVMFKEQSRNTCKFLQTSKSYEKCSLWLQEKCEDLSDLYFDALKPSEKFNIFLHGDCWTNNILFSYDAGGRPKDIRLVDLQVCRKSSPACDLIYFMYSSLNGEDRRKYFKKLLVTYYLSFSEVLLLAGNNLPFTFEELENEMNERILLGLFTGMTLLPIILAEKEDEMTDPLDFSKDNFEQFLEGQNEKFHLMSQRDGLFRDRFLSLFDDMLQFNAFDD